MSEEFDYPRSVRSSLKIKLAQTDQGPHVAAASNKFLEAMRPILQYDKSRNDNQTFVPAGQREDLLSECHDKFCGLLKFVSGLPEHIRIEMNNGIYELGLANLEKIKNLEANEDNLTDQEIEELRNCKAQADSKPLNFDDLENLLSRTANASALKRKSINKRAEVFGRKDYRTMFLKQMMLEYRKAFGEFPYHTYKRGTDAEDAKVRGFHGVAHVMCELVGYSPKGIEKTLALIKTPKPLRPIEEVQAELKARKEAKPAD